MFSDTHFETFSTRPRGGFRGKSNPTRKNSNSVDFKSHGIFGQKVWDPNPEKSRRFSKISKNPENKKKCKKATK